MIPKKLSMRNFMPYRDNVPPLDFTGIHTVSICGNNGNGKSAIIDAMTWALWGETRAKRDDDLIHQGQDEMSVEFEFTVSEQNYRVIRKHARPRRRGSSGQSSLNFQVAREDGFRSIDGDTMAQTQQKIIDTLHMDYSTFTNSAYLRQGHADEFTTSSPSKRKQVLASILGLDDYDNFETKAKDTARQCEMVREQMKIAIAEIEHELLQKQVSVLELGKAQSELTLIEESLERQESFLKGLRVQKETLESKRAQSIQLEKNIGERLKTFCQWQEQIKQLQSRIKEHEALFIRRAEIESGYNRFVEVKNLNDVFNKNLTVVNRLNQRCHELEIFIERESQSLTKEHALLQSKVMELEKLVQQLPRLKEELLKVKAELNQISTREEELRNKRDSCQEDATLLGRAEADRSLLEKEIAEIDEKLTLLGTQPGTAKCPVCQTELGVNGLQHLSAHYNAEKQGKSDSIREISTTIATKIIQVKSLETEILQIEKSLTRDRTQTLNRSGALDREIARAEEAGIQIDEEKAKLIHIEERLAHKDFALPQLEMLKKVSTELASLNYDSQKHELTRREVETLQKYEVPKHQLEDADKLINRERDDIARSEKAATDLQEGLNLDNQKKQEVIKEIALLVKVPEELAQAESEFKRLSAAQKQAQGEIGVIKGKLEYFARREAEKGEKEKQLNLVVKEASIYRDLAEAFGKKGIQALLIETSLPEIEEEANRLLARMTDSRMHVKIETQRETQKGDIVETLEIKISDELGTRNYEMFSGGESFRINFAIRIALSRLLARRAGAPLPTLIIDEGFGTQDASGIEKLKEAINSIQDDFEKILVITHVEELRDAFPARIDVVKTADGSTISLN